uniref:Uncharacterized protein n=1 Tax=Triparma pacifica TaxID=91992 RepID=A0A7S2QUR1_9STRA|mmetsp:Transcript_1151/g.2121  ORF Transcript_1151/g.2121 Transcript_1151/m.2121 type:complete len:131 (+) Transcript_1151:280-672(+)
MSEKVVTNFTEVYDEHWDRLMTEVESIGRTYEDMEEDQFGNYTTATAKVHLVVKDEVVIGKGAFEGSVNLWKVTETRTSGVCVDAFYRCVNLIEAILPSANSVGFNSFGNCEKLTNVRLPNVNSVGEWSF